MTSTQLHLGLSSARQPGGRPAVGVRTISCDSCVMADTDACGDCVVTYICRRSVGDAIVIDLAEERALRLLSTAGLVPGLRHQQN